MKRYLLIDTELTSFSKENSLIIVYLGIVENHSLINELDLKLIPDNGQFIVDPESMNVNQIDLRGWTGIRYKDASRLVDDFIRQYVFNKERIQVDDRLIVVGQAVGGDVKSIQDCLISENRWNEAVERTPIDTLYIARFLKDIGKLDLDSLSLKSLATHFKLDTSQIHEARFDALLTWQVYSKLKELL